MPCCWVLDDGRYFLPPTAFDGPTRTGALKWLLGWLVDAVSTFKARPATSEGWRHRAEPISRHHSPLAFRDSRCSCLSHWWRLYTHGYTATSCNSAVINGHSRWTSGDQWQDHPPFWRCSDRKEMRNDVVVDDISATLGTNRRCVQCAWPTTE